MKISSLEEAERIVENNDDLGWSGWSIVHYKKSPTAWMKPNGVYKDGSWYIQKHYNLSEEGWELPAKFVR